MRELSRRQLEVLLLLDAAEWRPLERPDAIVAGFLCKEFRPGARFIERQPDLKRSNSASLYRLTKHGKFRVRFEKDRP